MKVDTETIDLAWKQCHATLAISEHMLRGNLEFTERVMPEMFGRLIHAVYTYLAKDELLATYPATWWQAVKQRWFPKWLLRRFPVQYTEIHVEHMFPQVPIPLGKRESVRMYRTNIMGLEAQERVES